MRIDANREFAVLHTGQSYCGSAPALRRACVGHFSQSCWTKELSIGKLQNRNSEQFGSDVGYWEKHIRIGSKPTHILTFARCFPCFGNDEVGSSILPSSTMA